MPIPVCWTVDSINRPPHLPVAVGPWRCDTPHDLEHTRIVMQDKFYSVADAERDLARVLSRAPEGAVSGAWTTTVQAGVSSSNGGYVDTRGVFVEDVGEPSEQASDAICAAVERLKAEGDLPLWNMATVRWHGKDGQVDVTTGFDPDIVPRGPNDPIYERAAAARRRFWQEVGGAEPDYLAESTGANVYGQTKWFGPHRRVLLARRPTSVLLATDGLSTPWAGVPTKENGVECEICIELANPGHTFDRGLQGLRPWVDLLFAMGDVIADGYRIARDIEENGPVACFKLGAEYAPAVRIVLSLDEAAAVTPARMNGLPFGPALLLTATPVTEADLVALDLSGERSAEVARFALHWHAAHNGA